MPTIEVPVKVAQSGVKITTGGLTTIQVRLASIELLIGGPYTKDGKEHTYGHMATRVTTSESDKIYDYGRYGNITGEFGAEGEGILRVWTSFAVYIAGENFLGRMTTGFLYEISEEKAISVNRHYELIVGAGQLRRIRPAGSPSPTMREYLIAQKYHGITSNCVTMSLSGARIPLPRIDETRSVFNEGRGMSRAERAAARVRNFGWPSHIFMPADVHAMLEADRFYVPKRVTKYGGRG